MKFLYAHGDVFAIARFWKEDILVGVISKSDSEETIRLPLGAIGAGEPDGLTDLLDNTLRWERNEKHAVSLRVEPHGNYLFRCRFS